MYPICTVFLKEFKAKWIKEEHEIDLKKEKNWITDDCLYSAHLL